MDYEKKYKEALERAREKYAMFEGMKQGDVLEDVFPELAESEDERIRKAIVKIISDIDGGFPFEKHGIIKKKALAWLEKQGEQRYLIGVDLGDFAGDKGCRFDYSNATIQQKDFAPKDEPKFKVGDWVIDKQGFVHQVAKVVENVTNHTWGYDVVDGGYFNDNVEGIRLWTIQDAKNGDVLVCEDYGYTSYLLLKSFSDKTIELHCWYNGQTNNLHNGTEVITREDARIHPATKEQRDLLFQKMREAGYEWDAEKKELKLLITNGGDFESEICEQNHAWSEEDEEMLSEIITDIKFAQSKYPDSQMNQIIIEEEVNWLKSIKQRMA